MSGRATAKNPWHWAMVDKELYGDEAAQPNLSRRQVLAIYGRYCDEEVFNSVLCRSGSCAGVHSRCLPLSSIQPPIRPLLSGNSPPSRQQGRYSAVDRVQIL